MRYIRPFEPSEVPAGGASPWLVAPEEELGCAIRLRRGGAAASLTSMPVERFAMVISGEATLQGSGDPETAPAGSLVFIPAGQAAAVAGDADTCWVEVEAAAAPQANPAKVIRVDPARFEGGGFAYQSLAERNTGAQSMRINVLQVQPGAGSPDFHIHAFAQIYLILDGEMTVDVGRARVRAGRNSIVCLPPGVVHRNFNASQGVERHISLLVPEPAPDAIFDYAVDIHDREAEILQALPA